MANENLATTEVRLSVSQGPDLHFQGAVIGEYTTQNSAGSKDRWTELRLWETAGGNWIAERVGRSSRPGEGDIRAAAVIGSPHALVRRGLAGPERFGEQELRLKVMDLFDWTSAAKAFARDMGWDIVQRVD